MGEGLGETNPHSVFRIHFYLKWLTLKKENRFRGLTKRTKTSQKPKRPKLYTKEFIRVIGLTQT